MALTPQIRSPQSFVLAVVQQLSREERIVQAHTLSVYNIPAEQLRATAISVMPVYRRPGELRASQGHVLAVVSGRVDTPKVRSWGFTLDGHDFFVLKLGTGGKTLVYDISTGEWSWWSSGDRASWRASVGLNWNSAGSIPHEFGTNVIVGDDSGGVLWVLDPMHGLDDSFIEGSPRTFPRVATGQVPVRGREDVPVYNVFLTANRGRPALTANEVSLEYSDDAGRTFVSAAEPQTVGTGNWSQVFTWRSMGQMRAPGRLFRVTDNGAFARVDSLDVNE